jgi:hypothetical protein
MASKTQTGYFLLADISGYTSFMAGTELEHSQDILSELLELILHQLTSVLTLSKLEGDAVFAYAPDSKITPGDSLLNLIEATYIAFRDRQENMHRSTTCTCNACRAIPTLDLKFFLHHGEYFIQKISTIEEVVGTDVNLVHRLMKNHITEATGWKAYALLTQKSLERCGLSANDLNPHSQIENYEHLGDVQTYSFDLRSRYKELVEARHVFLEVHEADLVFVNDFNAPPPVIWEWMTDPQKRTRWMYHRTWSAQSRPQGRNGVGAHNHCAHGKDVALETILDWRPFNYVTVEQLVSGSTMIETIKLEAIATGTRVQTHIKIESTLPRPIQRLITRVIITQLAKYKNEEIFANLARLLKEERTDGN